MNLASLRRLMRTLRGRLVFGLLSGTVAALAVMGAASVTVLQHSLMTKVDERLTAMTAPWEHGMSHPLPGDGPSPRALPSEFRLVFFDPNGNVLGMTGQTNGDPSGPDFSSIGNPVVRPETIPDRAGGPAWRVQTVDLPDGSRIAVALSLDSVQSTVRELIIIELIVGAIVLIVLAIATTATVQLGLRPLTKIEDIARAIAAGDLSRRIPDQDPATETGRLGAALNTMLGRLVSALQQREHSQQRLRRFVADASHELRTPLTSIRGFAELYRRSHDVSDEQVRQMMSRIENEAVRMGRLVEDLLLLARLDRERSVDLVDLDLAALVHDVVHDGRVRDPSREIGLDLSDHAPRVLADEPRLRQVLDNLLTNALLHTAPASPVSVAVGHGTVGWGVAAAAGVDMPADKPMGVVEIADVGPGIPPEHAQRIFDRFYQVENGGAPRGGGTGLGLAITAAIAEAHNGRVELMSNHQGGSTFRLLIPLS